MARTYRVSWNPIAGSFGYKVELRDSISSIWTVPSSSPNPTLNTYYDLSLTDNKTYYVRISSQGVSCTSVPTVITIQTPGANCCATGYTLSPDGTYCSKVEEIAATPPTGTPSTLVKKSFAAYSTCGSYIYSSGWALNGTGTSSHITTSNPFWQNGGTCVDNNTTSGPLNRSGVWSSTVSDNQDVGFAVCLNIPISKTYYVGVGSDNFSKIKLDGTLILSQDKAALDIQYPFVGALSVPFKIWHIYPIVIPSGFHILEILGHNDASVAAMGAEIYNNTSAQIIAATSYAGLNLTFSSKDYVGQTVQVGTNNAGYTCPDGYALKACQTPYTCARITQISTIPC